MIVVRTLLLRCVLVAGLFVVSAFLLAAAVIHRAYLWVQGDTSRERW